MVIPADIEIRPDADLSPKERAEARHSFVCAFERQFSDWTEIAKVCIEVERDKDYLVLGYQSWHQWLLAAAPRSRSYIYLVVGRYKELSPDIPEEELAQISLGSAGVLKQLSPAVRKLSKIRQASKGKPSELRQVLRDEFPSQHIETIVERTLYFTTSQWERIEAAYEAYRLTDEGASLETFIEWLCSEQDA
jgi:hypothetical protein